MGFYNKKITCHNTNLNKNILWIISLVFNQGRLLVSIVFFSNRSCLKAYRIAEYLLFVCYFTFKHGINTIHNLSKKTKCRQPFCDDVLSHLNKPHVYVYNGKIFLSCTRFNGKRSKGLDWKSKKTLLTLFVHNSPHGHI